MPHFERNVLGVPALPVRMPAALSRRSQPAAEPAAEPARKQATMPAAPAPAATAHPFTETISIHAWTPPEKLERFMDTLMPHA